MRQTTRGISTSFWNSSNSPTITSLRKCARGHSDRHQPGRRAGIRGENVQCTDWFPFFFPHPFFDCHNKPLIVSSRFCATGIVGAGVPREHGESGQLHPR